MAALDEWCKEIAPSTELRKWYGHDPERFEEFDRRYQAELAEPEWRRLGGGPFAYVCARVPADCARRSR